MSYKLTNRVSGETTPLDYAVEITATPCHFGGQRYWFRCPLVRRGLPCGKRVGKLYLPPGGRYFGYRSCQEHDKRVDALLKLGPRTRVFGREPT